MLQKKTEALSAVSMFQYGMEMVVLTEHKNLEAYRAEFERKKDSDWMGGRGKKFMYKKMKKALLADDKYFTNHKKLADKNNPNWVRFCDQCVMFAVLSSVLYGTPVYLIHPDQFGTTIRNSTPQGFSGRSPTLIIGIDVVHLN